MCIRNSPILEEIQETCYTISYSSVRKIIAKRKHTKRINELLEQIDRRVC